jgi:hypothetical protein
VQYGHLAHPLAELTLLATLRLTAFGKWQSSLSKEDPNTKRRTKEKTQEMTSGKLTVTLLALFLFLTPRLANSTSPAMSAIDVVREAIRQMGGEDKLQALRGMRFKAASYRNALEQSERPEGPYIVEYDEISESRDLEHASWKQEVEMNFQMQPAVKVKVVVADGAASREFSGHSIPASRDQLQQAEEALELCPERVLLTASAAPDLRLEPNTVLQSVPNRVVTFTWKESSVRLFLNAYTSFPTAVEWKSAYPSDTFWGTWGDVTTRVYYSLWWLYPGGIHYPRQWDTFRNNLPERVVTISDLDLNPTFASDEFAIAADVRANFAKAANRTVDDRPLGLPGQSAVELAKEVAFIPGAWNTTLVKQSDGIVVIEAPIASGYSAKVIAEAERRWPGAPIKAVISTSDSWPHIAGVREYVARGIPVYALDLNLPILQRLVDAPRTSYPDLLAKAPRKPDFRAVSDKVVLGDGPNRLELYPLRGETSERQMMVYFPQHKLLYGSDPFQKDESGQYFYPQTVWEVKHAVEREKLQVDTFFMMHMGPTPWSDLDKATAQAENSQPAK